MQNKVDSASDDRTANNALGKSRELSLAVTNAEQSDMWAVKHITA